MQIKKIVVACDSFKGSLSSLEVAQAVECGIRDAGTHCDVVKLAVADGGEGTACALTEALCGEMVSSTVHDPLMRPVSASYGMTGGRAIIEMSAASGITLVSPSERNPMLATSFGTGELIRDALDRGCRDFLIGIGGSATNDGGTGMMEALGVSFSDNEGNILPGRGSSLEHIRGIDMSGMDPRLSESRFTVACDVDTYFCGPEGAAVIFAPQKGATPEQVMALDRGLQSFQEVIRSQLRTDISQEKGAGAAGGMGGAFKAFLGAELKKGIEMVLDAQSFDTAIAGADLIFTGEGCLDSQTPKGKVPHGVLLRARKQCIPVIALGGSLRMCPELESLGFLEIAQTSTGRTLEESMMPERAAADVARKTAEIIRRLTI